MIVFRTFPSVPESVPTARHFVAEAIPDAPRDIGERAQMLVSELATNAVRHAQTEFIVRVELDASRLCVEIIDAGLGTPTLRATAAHELSGRGLRIVDVLADSWGVRESSPGPGKSVWFVLALPEHA